MSTHITESDKIAMCKACTLAECMKQCKICPFNIGLAQIASKPALNYKHTVGVGHYKNCPVCVGECVCP